MMRSSHALLAGGLVLGLIGPVAAQPAPGATDAQGQPIGVLFPLPAGHPWANLCGTMFKRIYNHVPHPETAIIRSPETLAKFVGDPERVASLLHRPEVIDRTTNKPTLGIPQLVIGPGNKQFPGSMLIGIHLGSQGSEGFECEITKIERTVQHPKVRITWRLIPKAAPQPGGGQPTRVAVGGAPGANTTVRYQTSAPAHVVRIPYLGDDPREFQFIEETLPMRFPGMEAIALEIESGDTENLDMRVNQLGVVWINKNGEPAGKALVSEMIALGEAIKRSKPLELIGGQGATPTTEPTEGALRSNVSYKLYTWHGEGNPQETGGSWDSVRARLQPLREALEAIKLRIEGKMRPEDLARLQNRLPFSELSLQILPVRVTQAGGGEPVEVLPALRVRVTRLGTVEAGDQSGTLKEAEWELLARVCEKTDPFNLPELLAIPSDIDPSTQVMPSTMHRKFKMEIMGKDGQTNAAGKSLHHVGGSLFGGDPEARARVQAIKQVLELIASRVERRPAEIAGEVKVEGEDVSIHWPLVGFTYKLDPVEGDPLTDANRMKIKEWAGRWVELKATARATTAETGEAVVTRIMYPQRAEVTGVFNGQGIQWQEPGLSRDALTIRVVGERSARILAGEQGRWVKVDVYLFYGPDLRPSEMFVEAVQIVVSRRLKFRWRQPSDIETTSVIKLYDRPDVNGMPAGVIHVPETGAEYYWVTDRRNGFSFIPDFKGWAREKDELFHVSEDPDDVRAKGRIDKIDIIDAVLKGLSGSGSTGTQR